MVAKNRPGPVSLLLSVVATLLVPTNALPSKCEEKCKLFPWPKECVKECTGLVLLTAEPDVLQELLGFDNFTVTTIDVNRKKNPSETPEEAYKSLDPDVAKKLSERLMKLDQDDLDKIFAEGKSPHQQRHETQR